MVKTFPRPYRYSAHFNAFFPINLHDCLWRIVRLFLGSARRAIGGGVYPFRPVFGVVDFVSGARCGVGWSTVAPSSWRFSRCWSWVRIRVAREGTSRIPVGSIVVGSVASLIVISPTVYGSTVCFFVRVAVTRGEGARGELAGRGEDRGVASHGCFSLGCRSSLLLQDSRRVFTRSKTCLLTRP